MPGRFAETRLFLQEFRRNFHTTGAVLPSGRFLSAALARFIREPADGPRRILEVGPGTGAVTRYIAAAMQPEDRLDLVELNESFVRQLEDRFQSDPAFQPIADRARVLHCAIEQLDAAEPYDLIVSGLPLNNFEAELVEQILASLTERLRPGGTLSFFEYIAIRSARTLISGRSERARLRGIGQALGAVLRGHEIRRDWIWINVLPAWVHHVRMSS